MHSIWRLSWRREHASADSSTGNEGRATRDEAPNATTRVARPEATVGPMPSTHVHCGLKVWITP
jgi:hypothetical protein